MKLIVGLGNPGKKYEKTRHNIGYRVIDAIAEKAKIDVDKKDFKGLFAKFLHNNEEIVLFKPTTYMNLSGEAVVQIMNFYKIEIENILIIYDDMSLSTGQVRLRMGGGSGGQKGMQNIIDLTGHNEIKRLRIGIGQPLHNSVDHVLNKPTKEEENLLEIAIEDAKNAVFYALEFGFEKSMSKFNKKCDREKEEVIKPE